MSRRDGIQLAVGSPTGLRGSLWEIWFGHRDIYLASTHFYNRWKASIHFERPNEPGRVHYIGITAKVAKALGRNSGRESRTDFEWSGIELAPGSDYFLEARIRVAHSELCAFGTADLEPLNRGEPIDVRWLPMPPPGLATEVTIISAPPHHSGSFPPRADGAPVDRVHQRRLSNGRFVWLLQHTIPAPSSQDMQAYRKRVATGQPIIASGEMRSGAARAIVAINCGDGSGAFTEFLIDIRGARWRVRKA